MAISFRWRENGNEQGKSDITEGRSRERSRGDEGF